MSTELIKADIAMQQFSVVQEKIKELADKCEQVQVTDDVTLEEGRQLAVIGRKLEKLIEDRRKELTKPYDDEKKKIMDFVKQLVAGVNNAVEGLRGRILVYEREMERQRQEKLRQLQAEIKAKEEEAQRKLREAAKNQSVDESIEAARLNEELMLDAQREVDFAKAKSSNIRMVWTFEVTNLNEIPREFLVLNETAVRNAIKAGTREIPGINIFQTEQLNLR